jgi:uncharacterized protein (UPF0548 family)
VFRTTRPTPEKIQSYLAARADEPFTYAEVGATRQGRSALPASVASRYDIDEYAARLGMGLELYEQARQALLAWRCFDMRWLQLFGAVRPVTANQVVATLVQAAGLWTLNPCRVVYVVDEREDPRCVAFAYGTLPGHAESGEERFRVTHSPSTDEVRCEVLAFSRPGHLLTRLGYPIARSLQRRFGRDALLGIARAATHVPRR